jgi:PAS domain S-box-containing protein
MIIEDLRLQTVAHFVDFNLEKDKELMEIVELAAAVTNLPYAVISFLDNETAYLKVRKGFSEVAIPRHLSFCTHALQQSELMIVPDASLDERFANNPFVTDGPRLRFFAGMPLIAQNGERIGVLCVSDIEPRILDSHQQLVLKILSNQVMKIVELKAGMKLLEKKQKELEEQKELNNNANIRLRSFFESSTNFQVLLGRNGEVIDFNKTAYNFIRTVHKAKLQRGDLFAKYIHPEFVATFLNQYKLALQGTKSAKEGSTDYEEMGVIWWEAAFEAARDDEGEIIGVSYLIRNVTERKLKEQKIIAQNQSLLKIAHIQAHEFRAPLTTIMGLMSLIKEENFAAPSEYIELLEQAVDTLDTTIRHIVTNIDDTVIQDYAADLQNG